MAKSIDLGSPLKFATITLAKAHFDPFRTGGELGQDLPQEQYEQLSRLYHKYCAKTQYAIPSAVEAFYPTMETRSGVQTRCLGGRFTDGTSTIFSLDKALSAIAEKN